MSEFHVTIETDNAAFADPFTGDESDEYRNAEVASILFELVQSLRNGMTQVRLLDSNGNRVGYAEFRDA